MMTRAELAKAFGVSKTMVRKWEQLGIPIAGTTAPHGKAMNLFDLEACRTWRAATYGTEPTGRGGKRTVSVESETSEETASGAVGTLSPAKLRQLVKDPTSQVVSLGEARAANEMFKASKTAAERDKLTGQMLMRNEVEEAWTEALVTLNRALDALPATVAPKLVHAAATAFDREAGVEFSMAEASRKFAARVRELVREGVDQARLAIVAAAGAVNVEA